MGKGIEPLTEPKPCPIFKSTGIKADVKKECDVCPFSRSCPHDMLDDVTIKIINMIGGYFADRGLEYQRGEYHGRGNLA